MASEDGQDLLGPDPGQPRDRVASVCHLLKCTARIRQAILRAEDQLQLFQDACRYAVEVGAFRLAWVGLLDETTGEVTPVVAEGPAQIFLEGVQPSRDGTLVGGQGPTGIAMRQESPYICNKYLEEGPTLPWRDAAAQAGIRSSAGFPLRCGGRVIGTMNFYADHPLAFEAESVDLLTALVEDMSYALDQMERDRRLALAEVELRSSTGLLTATLDTLTAAMGILDERGRILAANSAWTGFGDAENPLVCGLGIGVSYNQRCLNVIDVNSGLAPVAAGILEVLGGTRHCFISDYTVESVTGTRYYATTVTLFENDGLRRVLVAHREITERKHGENRMRHHEMLFRLITDNAMDLITITDLEGRLFYYSPSFHSVLGYSRQEMEAMEPGEILHPDDRRRAGESASKVAEGIWDAAQITYRLRRRSGEWGTFDARQVAIDEGDGAPIRLLLIARDVTAREEVERQRERMEVQLRHAQKLESIGQLAAGIAHEINTPTQYIGDNIRFILESLPDLFEALSALEPVLKDAEAMADSRLQKVKAALELAEVEYLRQELPKAAQQSLEGVARVAQIVGAMKEFSHPGNEDKTLADLNRAIESTITVSRNVWKYLADLTLELDPDLPPVPCHPGEINQVVLNLVVNAAHAIEDQNGAGGPKGLITVRTRREQDWAVIQVEDSGAGIPEAIRGRVFDPFFTTKGVGRGSGQGLSIAHSVVVDKHGGTIGFDTETGQGTLFTVRLPLAAAASRSLVMTKRILFVDDEPLVLDGLRRMLHALRSDWEMVFAEGGAAALAEMAQGPFDVVVSDLQMPGMNGARLLGEVKLRYPNTVRLALSGHADQDLVMQCVGLAHQYLSKPCEPALLKARIQQAGTLGQGLADPGVRHLVSRISCLPSLPSLYSELMKALESDHCNPELLGRIIGRDPAMTLKVLKLVNSAFFGLRREVSDPAQAVAYLGVDTVRSLVLAYGVFDQAGGLLTRSVSLEQIWTHSLKVAFGAKVIAGLEGLSRPAQEEAFTAGLVHDIGSLILARWSPTEYDDVISRTLEGVSNLEDVERDAFGATHSDVGAYLLGLWGLPEPIVRAVAWHHAPAWSEATEFSTLTAVHVADTLAWAMERPHSFEASQLDEHHLKAIGRYHRLAAWTEPLTSVAKLQEVDP